MPPRRHRDRLEPDIKFPLLTRILGSTGMRSDMMSVANVIKRHWVARVPKESGNAAGTARTYPVVGGKKRDRWEAVFEAGGPRAPYVVELENEHHILEGVLRDMGWNLSAGGQGAIIGYRPRQRRRSAFKPPPRKGDPNIPDTETVTVYHRTTQERAEQILADGFRTGDRRFVFFSTERDDPHYAGYGDEELSVQVPRNALSPDRNDRGNAVKVRRSDLAGLPIGRETRRTMAEIQARERAAGARADRGGGYTGSDVTPDAAITGATGGRSGGTRRRTMDFRVSAASYSTLRPAARGLAPSVSERGGANLRGVDRATAQDMLADMRELQQAYDDDGDNSRDARAIRADVRRLEEQIGQLGDDD